MYLNYISISLLVLFSTIRYSVQVAVINKVDDVNLFPLSIIHLNDFHARFEETNWDSNSCKPEANDSCIGGYARVITMVKHLKETLKDTNPLYLNIGDNFQGTLWYNLLRWNVTAEFLNMLPADAMTIGNHEFDHKIVDLVKFLEAIEAPVLVCNIDDTDEPTLKGLYRKSMVVERGGRRIGLIGVILQTTNQIAQTEQLKFFDESISVATEADRLHNEENCNIIIVLSHSGLDVDKRIARNGGPYIDVIVGGHSHTFMWTRGEDGWSPGPDTPYGQYPEVIAQDDGHRVLIVQASAYTKFLGNLTVWFSDDGEVEAWEGAPIFLDDSVQPDEEITRRLEPYKILIDKEAKQVVGVSYVDLSRGNCGSGDCNIGNLIADAFVNSYVDKALSDEYWTYSAIAFTNNGGIRTELPAGPIDYGDLKMVIPFDNTVDTFDLLGQHLWDALEFSVTSSMVQVSGLKIIADKSKRVGERLISVDVLCNKCKIPKYFPLNVNETYTIIAISYLADGGSGFSIFKDYRINHKPGGLDIDAVEDYIRRMSPLMSPIDGRFTILR